MIAFLFWNTHRQKSVDQVARLAREHQPDIVVLAEYLGRTGTTLEALNRESPEREYQYVPPLGETRITFFTRFSSDFVRRLEESERWSISSLHLPALPPVLMVSLHLHSPRHRDVTDKVEECRQLSRAIQRIEEKVGHERTMVLGDFNADPFSDGVVSAHGFHAVSSRRVARRLKRTVDRKEYPFFYNPSWRLLHEGKDGHPPGSFYYSASRLCEHFWHAFDQVLIRPALLPAFSESDLKVVTSIGDQPLTTRAGIPDKTCSDHLPVVCSLELAALEDTHEQLALAR